MGIARLGWQLVFGDLFRFDIQLANVTLGIRGEPDVSALVRYQSMGARIGRLQPVLLDLSTLRIYSTEKVCKVSGVPDRSIGSGQGVMRKGSSGENRPFPNSYFSVASNDSRRWLRAFGKTFCEIVQ